MPVANQIDPSTTQPDTTAPTGDVVVTGSRLIRNGDSSPAPVTVVATQDVLQVQPGTLSDALAVLPVFAGSRNTTSNPTFNGSQVGGNGNANQLNLRNLGANRTLVLLDGYRVPPTSFNNVVDVDIIPSMLVQRVDTVTGGVSAVYGSDAVAGVVNYIIDKKFKGFRIDADTGISQRGDAPRQQIGIAAGANLFGGSGHIEASYQYINEGGVDTRSSRPWINLWGVSGAGSAANPFVLSSNVRQGQFAFGGLVTSGIFSGQQFAEGGVLVPFVHGTATKTTALEIGGDGAYYDSQLVASQEAHQFFGRYDQEVSSNLRAYVQVSGDIKTNEARGDALKLTRVTIQANNPYLAPAYQAQLAAARQTTFTLSELMGNFSRLDNIAQSKQFTYSGGLDGSLGKFHLGVNFTHGVSLLNTTMTNNPNNQRLAAALDAVRDPATGNIVCNITLTNPSLANGCIPLNVFGPSAANSAALNYVLQPTEFHAHTFQDDFSANIGGPLFALPAGDVQIGLSGEWRKLRFREDTTAPNTSLVNCTGIRTNCSATGSNATLYQFSFANQSQISQTVEEGAAEIDVPLLKDTTLVKSLSFNGAARYTHYDTSGNYWTWKLGGVWEVTNTLRFRVTKSRDIRAPTLFELFAPRNSVPVSPLDTLTGLTVTVPSVDLNNPNLKAEIGDTITGGVSWKTPLPGLSLTLDAYRIKISDAIVQAAGSNTAYQALCYASGGTSPWCAFQSRTIVGNYTNTTSANAVTAWYTQYLNIGEIETEGADFEANFTSRLLDRPFNLRLLTAYQPHAYYRSAGVPTIDQGGVAFGPTGYSAGAKWRVSGFLHVEPAEGISLDVLERWRSAMKIGGDESLVILNNHIDPFATTNLTLSFATKSLGSQSQVSFNVSNLFDAHSPGGAYTGNGTRTGLRDGFVPGDDVIGRAFTVALRLRR